MQLIVHPFQRGFMASRSILDCVLDLGVEMLVGSITAAPRQGILLFDFAAAFPSAEWGWLARALSAQALPRWLRRLVLGLMRGSTARVRFSGRIQEAVVQVRRGIKQGCPSSGLLWALLLDLVVGRLVANVEAIYPHCPPSPTTCQAICRMSFEVGSCPSLERCSKRRGFVST